MLCAVEFLALISHIYLYLYPFLFLFLSLFVFVCLLLGALRFGARSLRKSAQEILGSFSAHSASQLNVVSIQEGIFTTAITHGLKVGAFEEDDQVGLQVLRYDPDRGGVIHQITAEVLANLGHNSREGEEWQAEAGFALFTLNHP